MRTSIRDGERRPGGVLTGYPLERIYKELAFIAYYFHWPSEEVMNMEHRERQHWCEEISRINQKINQEAQPHG
jgi:hypothetical protein